MQFIGLNPQPAHELEDILGFIGDVGITWPVGYGAQPTIEALGVVAFPTVIVVGTDGRIEWHDAMGGSLDEAIDQALARRTSRN